MEAHKQIKPLLSLCNDHEHYFRCTNHVYEISSWLPDYMKWVNTNLGRQVLDRMDVNLQPGEKLRILGMGSGNGKVELNLIMRLLSKYPAIHSTVVDPNQIQVNLYKNLIEDKKDELKRVEFDFRLEALSKYKQLCHEADYTAKFHVISSFFSLYYEKETTAMLAYMYDRLAPGGVILVALESETCDVMKVEDHFKFAQDEWNYFFSSQHVFEYFEKRGIPYVSCKNEADHSDFDITTCFDDADPNGDLILDFISDVINFRKNVSPEILKNLRDHLMGIATKRDGKVFLRHDADHVIVTKQ